MESLAFSSTGGAATFEQLKEIVAPQPVKRKKVAILGFAESWKLAPFADPSFEIWGLNELYALIQHLPHGRWDRWFEIHSREVYVADTKRLGDHEANLAKLNVPVYMQRTIPEVPNSVVYPMDKICEAFPNPSPGWKPYFNNTISYMIALAIYEGFEEIHVYGVDMASDSEYGSQRPSCEYFIGLATGRGIKTYIPPVSDLLKTIFFYGYEQPSEEAFTAKLKNRNAELQAKAAAIQEEIKQKNDALQQYYGAMQDCQHIMKNWSPLSK